MPKVSYHSNEDSARNAWTTLCAKNGMPEAINSGGSAANLKESEIHALRKTTRRALNTISDTMKPADYNDVVTDALVYAGNTIESCNEALERIQDAEKFFGKSKSNNSKILRNTADFERHFKSGRQGEDGEMGIADFFRGVAGMKTSPSVTNALSVGTDASGGFTVPGVLMPGILGAMVPVSSLLTAGVGFVMLEEGAKTYTTAGINAIPAAAWRLEAGTLATSDATFRAVVATPKSLAFQFKISRELLADASGIEAALYQAIAQAFAKELDRAGLRGSGTNPEPRGLLNTVGVQSVTNGANGLTLGNYANLFSGVQAILQADGPMPTSVIMAPRSLVKLGGLVTTTNEYLDPPTMLASIKQIATSQIPIALTVGTSTDCSEMYLGDFTNMLFAMRESVSIQMLREAYASTGEIGFACHARVDVLVNYASAFAVITGVRA
jgi:HK97 family phage major capsid protein